MKLNIQNFEQSEEDIPNLLKHNIMHPDIYYYYKYLNHLMDQKGLLKHTGTVIYSGIGADISSVETLLGSRQIIGFDAAGLKTYTQQGKSDTEMISWYDSDELNNFIDAINNPHKQFNTQVYLEEIYNNSAKNTYGGYYTYDLRDNGNGKNLLGELLTLGISPKNISFKNAIYKGIKYFSCSFNNPNYEDIVIYQVDVLDQKKYGIIEEIINKNNASYYFEKSGQYISGSNIKLINGKYTSQTNIAIPLEIMNYRKETQVMCIGSGSNTNPRDKIVGKREKINDIHMKQRVNSIEQELSYELQKIMPEKDKQFFKDYWRKMNIFYYTG